MSMQAQLLPGFLEVFFLAFLRQDRLHWITPSLFWKGIGKKLWVLSFY